jgi:hypothetical protein
VSGLTELHRFEWNGIRLADGATVMSKHQNYDLTDGRRSSTTHTDVRDSDRHQIAYTYQKGKKHYMLNDDPNHKDGPKTLKPTENGLLQGVYLDVVAFEEKVRSSFGAEFATLMSDEKLDGFSSQLMDLIGEDSSDAKLAYVRLVNDVLVEIEHAFPVRTLQVLWPTHGATRKAAFLLDHGCDCLADIVQQASKRLPRSGPFSNKFKF